MKLVSETKFIKGLDYDFLVIYIFNIPHFLLVGRRGWEGRLGQEPNK